MALRFLYLLVLISGRLVHALTVARQQDDDPASERPPTRGLPPAYAAELEAVVADFESTPFVVLVWGSGLRHDRGYARRCRIRRYLAQSLGCDQVFFSEDAVFDGMTERLGVVVSEGLQVIAADAVVVCDTSIGPHAEVLTYAEELRGKAIVFVDPERAVREGFAATALDTLKTVECSPEQWDDEEYLGRRALYFVQELKRRKWLERRRGG